MDSRRDLSNMSTLKLYYMMIMRTYDYENRAFRKIIVGRRRVAETVKVKYNIPNRCL
jgi:hypothetical protein